MKNINQLFDKNDFFHLGKEKLVAGITNNSKNVDKNFIFFAIKGTKSDGHQFVEEAIKKGAVCVVAEDINTAVKVKNQFPDISIIYTENTRKKQAEVARKFYEHPDKELKVIGVTGTNGKTTVSHLIAQLLELSGKNVGVIGTINYRVGERVISEGRTTPDSIEWFSLLRKMRDMGAEYVVAEISSHALDQYRVYRTDFSGTVFTNLSQDHLDYHKDMESYFNAKEKLFKAIGRYTPAVINTDDIYGRRIYEKYRDKNVSGYGRKNTDFVITDLKLSEKGSQFCIAYGEEKHQIRTSLIGLFNVYNVAAAFSLMVKMEFPVKDLIENIKRLKPVRGRVEIVKGNDFTVVIDYAHTPDALKNILETLNQFKKGRVITVFGAGGDRDKGKRPLMGKVASELSDIVVITTDNPRTENPLKIIEDIKKGIQQKEKITVIPDREKAIKKAVELAEKGDIVLIAGKGHETYQIIGDQIIHFDDREVAEKYIKKRQQMLPRQEKY
ncbi:UDP-N-acetylmuramoyl-L-alanyl-D-glutamate--2,6-diaminopimelate ligase [Persephonella hydrogeniphila]|uniref:UDP-N-acetylmuramoyl-L-alanyl-D-glutamate--2, 6-diaminopimelate ligase n=1 Tax=Persephonella hydrogeniphila TaxID=198703 RepID=UPI001FEC6B60|nr:UDP-N-acetylmuramoyl-L-alanyl-D-glutamate--2,6-diaminopimelate ligase [Persephonella hydrogeniphila]